MAEQRYRLQTEEGLSKQYSLQRLREKLSVGVIDESMQCTADEGASWSSLAAVLAQDDQSASNKDVRNSESASIAQSETTVDIASDGSADAAASGQLQSRRLRRLPAGSGTGKLARLKAARERQKTSAGVTKPEDLVGVALAGDRYQIVDQLGKGSMAYVFRATDNRLMTDVVIKIPKPEKLTDSDIRERFKRESQLLVQLSHPHVVKVLDVGEFDELPFVVMQLLSGGTLIDRIKAESKGIGGVPPENLKTWLQGVGRALDFCNRKGMVHRDVKPANILFDEDGNAYVSDFGLTKIMFGDHDNVDPSDTAAGIVLGTPNYIAPEIVLGKKYDGRADQYSLGITVYHALFGKAPMQGDNATATMINQTQKQLQLLSDIRSDVPRELALAVRRSIEKDPAKRFESCEEFADAVIDGLRGTSTEPSPVRKDVGVSASSGGSSQSSVRRRRRKSAKSSSSSSRMSSSSISAISSGGADWFDMDSDDSVGESLPPRKPKSRTASTAKKKKTGRESHTKIFGQDVHPALVITLAAGVCLLLLSIAVRAMFGGEEDPPAYGAVSPEPIGGQPSADSQAGHSTPAGTAKQNSKPRSSGQNGNGGAGRSKQAKAAEKNQAQNAAPPKSDAPPSSKPATSAQNVALSSDAAQKQDSYSSGVVSRPASSSMSEEALVSNVTDDESDTIPYAFGDRITTGPPGCSVVVVGNRVWRKDTGVVSVTLEGQYAPAAFTALSPDGSLFAAAAKAPNQQDTDVIVWDTKSGRQLFTAKGQSGKYSDAILLSERMLYVGGRWSHELLTWDCSSGDARKALQLPDSRIQHGTTALSNDGEFLVAAFSGRLLVLNAVGGKPVGTMQSPAERSRRGSSNAQQVLEETDRIYASLQSLKFSQDNLEVAGIVTHPSPRVLCWNNRGELVLDQDLPVGETEIAGSQLQWFPDGGSWLIGNRIVDRQSGRILAYCESVEGSQLYVLDDERICGVFLDDTDKLTVRHIPWNDVRSSLAKLEDEQVAKLSPGMTVGIQVVLPNATAVQNAVRSALTKRLSRDGIKVDASVKETFFRVSAAEADGQRLMIEFVSSGQSHWKLQTESLTALGDEFAASPEATRKTMLEDVSAMIGELTTPYFLPKDPQLHQLPLLLSER